MHQYTLTPVDYNPFSEGREIASIVFLNEPQKDIWLSCLLAGKESNLAYNESVSLDLKGHFNIVYFQEAIREVVSRHEALRATVSVNGEILIIYKDFPFDIPMQDISLVEDKETAIQTFISQEMLHEFDLKKGPLFRFFLHKKSESSFFFTLVIHHIIADGWSFGVILEDLSKLYNGKVNGKPALLETAPQIGSYAEEQEKFTKTEAYQQAKKFWMGMYDHHVPTVNLPIDYPRTASRTYKASRVDYILPAELIDQLKLTGAKAGCSLVNTLFSAFEFFLYLQTGQRDLVIGLPTAGQAVTGYTGLVGHCVNLLALRCDVDPDLTFNEFLKIRRNSFFDAYDHQNFTYGKLTRILNLKRDPSRITMVSVVFNIDKGMENSVLFEELDFKMVSNPRAFETFEIFLNITGSDTEYILEWSYNTQLFKESTIKKMAASFDLLIKSIIANPVAKLKTLSAKNTDTFVEQLKRWNDTDKAYLNNKSVADLINQAAMKFPDKTALVYKKETLTYKQLIEQSNRLAHWFIKNGIKTGDIIGLSAERSMEMVICLLAIVKSGAIYLPLDPEFPQERLAYMLSDANAKMLVVSKSYASRFDTDANEAVIEDIWDELAGYPATHPAVFIQGTDLVYILYTSGSTGIPKGVKITHQNLINFLISMQRLPGIDVDDRVLAITTISFDIAGLELYLPLITGAELILCDTQTARDGRLLLEILEKKKITFMQGTPATWRMMLDSGWNKKHPLKVLCGGEALSKDLATQLLPHASALFNMYGPTETTIWSTIKQVTAQDETITIGKPIYNTKVYILDENLQPVASGNHGELFIGGDGLAAGYLNRPELTAAKFIKDPFSHVADARLYRTGDLGMFTATGEVQLFGRIDQQVKIRGYRIEPGEIEAQLLLLDDIKQAVVVAKGDHADSKRLIAYIILKEENDADLYADGSDILHDGIIRWRNSLKQHLPNYMMPAEFIVLKTFPLTPNHKIDRQALPSSAVQTNNAVRPQYASKNEIIIAEIWSKVLGIKNIHSQHDFFELGGHSLLAVQVMIAIEEKTGNRLPLAILFENSTVEKLAKKIEGDDDEKWDALVPIKISGTKEPVYMIHGGGLNVLLYQSISKLLDKEQPVYGLQALGLNKPIKVNHSIEEIASAYIAEIIEVNPEGPYNLVGYSLGGVIAFEMAKQLTRMGKKIRFIGIIDTYAGNMKTPDESFSLLSKIIRQFRKIPFIVRSFIDNPAETWEYQTYYLTDRIKNIFSSSIKSDNTYFTPYEEEIYKNYELAHQEYVMLPSEIKISLFRVEKRLYYLDDPVYLGWEKFAGRGVSIYEIPGDHATFLKPPYDREFAKVLQSAIDKSHAS